jgi:hypothetical protein
MVTSFFEGHLIDLLEVEGSLTDTPVLCADSRQGVLRLCSVFRDDGGVPGMSAEPKQTDESGDDASLPKVMVNYNAKITEIAKHLAQFTQVSDRAAAITPNLSIMTPQESYVTIPRIPPRPEIALLKRVVNQQELLHQTQAALLDLQRGELERSTKRDQDDAHRDKTNRQIALWALAFALVAAITGVVALLR